MSNLVIPRNILRTLITPRLVRKGGIGIPDKYPMRDAVRLKRGLLTKPKLTQQLKGNFR